MTEDIAEFMLASLGPPRVADRRSGSSNGRYTGAAISKATLVLATIEAGPTGRVQLCAEATCHFVLQGRSQRSVRDVAAQLAEFTRENGICNVLLRENAGSSPYLAAPTAYMLEATLGLVKKLALERVSPNTLQFWERHEGEGAPAMPEDTPRVLRIPLANAIQAACLMEARTRDPRFVPREKA